MYYFSWRIGLIFLIVLFIIGTIRWGLDSIKEQFGGKQAKKRDEERTMKRLDAENKMFFTGPGQAKTPSLAPDENIEKLIREGDLDLALTAARELRMISIEMNDHNSINFYAAYEAKINALLAKRKVSTY